MLVGVVGPDIPLLGCLGVDLPVLVCLEFDVSSLAFLKVLVHSDSPQPPIFSVRASAADVIMMVEGLSWVQVPRTFSRGPLDCCRGARLQGTKARGPARRPLLQQSVQAWSWPFRVGHVDQENAGTS